MADAIFEKGREGFVDGTLDWDTQTFAVGLLDFGTATTAIKPISGATNATPIVVTATAHGFANGDIVSITGVAGNAAANGIWQIGSVAANTFALLDPVTGGNTTGSGAYTSGGTAICLGPSAAGDNWDDFSGALVGSLVNLTSPTVTSGVIDAADPTVAAVTGASVEGYAILRNTGTGSTSRMVALVDGHQIVTCAAAAATSATSVAVERLRGPIANGATLVFSNGASATLSAQANAGDRLLTVSALAAAITAGSRADAAYMNSGLPVTPNGGSITITFDNGANKIAKI